MRLSIINGWKEGHFKAVKAKGLDGVEFCVNHNYDSAEVLAEKEEIKANSEKYGVAVVSIGRWGMRRIDENGEIIPEALQHDKNLIDLASYLGCPVFNVGCNYTEGKSYYENCMIAVDYFGRLNDESLRDNYEEEVAAGSNYRIDKAAGELVLDEKKHPALPLIDKDAAVVQIKNFFKKRFGLDDEDEEQNEELSVLLDKKAEDLTVEKTNTNTIDIPIVTEQANDEYLKKKKQTEEIEAAAKLTHADRFINKLPKGYDTQIDELGYRLSDGERKRIGIARAFLHNAPLILLDEPSEHLDSLNEGMILKALADECQDKTIVIASTRDSAMRACDTVFEMNA